MLFVSAMADTTFGNSSSNESGCTKRGLEGEDIKDEAYWERRRKNNESTKLLEDEIAILAAFLEQENLKLRFKLANLFLRERIISFVWGEILYAYHCHFVFIHLVLLCFKLPYVPFHHHSCSPNIIE
jgi:hypothetical protein